MEIVWKESALFPSSLLAFSLSTKQGLLILKRTSVARSQKNKSWCVSCNLISNKTSNKTSCTIFNIRLKYLEMIINVISKISYKKNTLTWYRSFKQNFFNNLIINNLIHKRIMKKVYNKFIEWTLSIIALLLYIPLVTVKLTMKVVVKIARAIIFVIEEVFTAIVRITEGLEERLSIKD